MQRTTIFTFFTQGNNPVEKPYPQETDSASIKTILSFLFWMYSGLSFTELIMTSLMRSSKDGRDERVLSKDDGN